MKYDGHKNTLYSACIQIDLTHRSAKFQHEQEIIMITLKNGLRTKLYNQLEISAYFRKYCLLFQLFVFEKGNYRSMELCDLEINN
jgi:hypothetical protein